MKKNFSKLMGMLIGTMLLMTSCLGDSDTTATLGNDFIYIGYSDGTKYAMTSIGMVVADELTNSEKLSIGDCAFVALKINTDNKVGNMYKAEYFSIDDDKIFRNGSQIQPQEGRVFRDTLASDKMFFKEIIKHQCLMSPYTLWGNRVFFTYTYTKRKSEIDPVLVVTYSPDQQKDLSGNELKEGECVLDFELKRQGDAGTGVDFEKVTKSVVINLSAFRNEVRKRAKAVDGADKTATLDIYFRLFKEKENPSVNDQYELAFDTKSGFYFVYSGNELN